MGASKYVAMLAMTTKSVSVQHNLLRYHLII
jgi:hypothetical protein